MQPLWKLLDDHRDALVAGWLMLIHDAAGPLYADLPLDELYGMAMDGFDGLVELLRSGNDQPLHQHVDHVVRQRSLQGFQLAEVQRAFISLREVIWPLLLANFPDRDRLAKAMIALDLAMHHAVLEYSLAYEAQVTKRLQQLAITDPLTGLYNRRYLDLMLRNELARLGRPGHVLSLLFIDIDHFKRFNDTYGHLCGDRALAMLAGVFRGHVRAGDVITRYGGEEFVIVLPEAGSRQALHVAERLRQHAADMVIPTDDGPARLTISIGVATVKHRVSAKSLLRAADKAAYQAKGKGRNCVCVAPPPTKAAS